MRVLGFGVEGRGEGGGGLKVKQHCTPPSRPQPLNPTKIPYRNPKDPFGAPLIDPWAPIVGCSCRPPSAVPICCGSVLVLQLLVGT